MAIVNCIFCSLADFRLIRYLNYTSTEAGQCVSHLKRHVETEHHIMSKLGSTQLWISATKVFLPSYLKHMCDECQRLEDPPCRRFIPVKVNPTRFHLFKVTNFIVRLMYLSLSLSWVSRGFCYGDSYVSDKFIIQILWTLDRNVQLSNRLSSDRLLTLWGAVTVKWTRTILTYGEGRWCMDHVSIHMFWAVLCFGDCTIASHMIIFYRTSSFV